MMRVIVVIESIAEVFTQRLMLLREHRQKGFQVKTKVRQSLQAIHKGRKIPLVNNSGFSRQYK
ncbi:MAG: hypothetical protein AB7L76_12755 [Burkholderiaceae bacterium]